MAPFPGGSLIFEENKSSKGEDGEDEIRVVIGAIGVSGAAGLEDEECAKVGVYAYEVGK